MATLRLTDKAINREPPATGQVELWDTVLPGFGLRISYGGKRTYFVMTRIHGVLIRRTVGTPLTHDSLGKARAAARKVLEAATRGEDIASRKAVKEAARRAKEAVDAEKDNTVRAAFAGYLADDVSKYGAGALASKRLIEQRFENHVYPSWGERPISEITHDDVDALIERVAKPRGKHVGGPIAANRLLNNLHRAFKWAVKNRKIKASPSIGIEAPGIERSRNRVLDKEEIVRLWSAFDELGYPFGPVFKLLLLTGQRRTEVGGMLWGEIKGDMWELPEARTKNRRPHLVPLSPQAREIIDSVPRIDGSAFMFTTGRRRGGEKDAAPVSGWTKTKARIDDLVTKATAKELGEKPDPKKHGMAHWTLHDLRRTMVTIMNEELRVLPHVADAAINHVSGAAKSGSAGTYNRAAYLEERTAALAAWGSYLETLTTGKPAGNVVVLAAKRA